MPMGRAMGDRLPLEVVILGNGDLAARRQSLATAVPIAERVRVLERDPALADAREEGVAVVSCDWADDGAARLATRTGDLPLLVVGAGEHVRVLDWDQAQRFLAGDAGGVGGALELSVELWTPSGWEIRLQSPGPSASDHIGDRGERRLHAVEIAETSEGSGWRSDGAGAARRDPKPRRDAPRFVIVTPGYQTGSGGIVALHSLCDRLNRLGFSAAVCPLRVPGPNQDLEFRTRDGWQTPVATRADMDGAVVVYPEILQGNPLGGERVVRWLLNRPGYISGAPMDEQPSDLLITYSSSIDPDLFTLFIPVVDPTVFFPKDVPGSGALLWVGKATAPAAIDVSAATEITRDWPASKPELAALLRAADVLYSCDSLSAVNLEATLCGTPVMLFPDERWDRSAIERYEGGTSGYAWHGEKSLEEARAQVADAYPNYLATLTEADRSVLRFVTYCEEYFSPSASRSAAAAGGDDAIPSGETGPGPHTAIHSPVIG